MEKIKIIVMIILIVITNKVFSREIEVPYTIADRDRLIRVETRLDELEKRINDLREDMNKRFEHVDKRFEQLNVYLTIISTIFGMITVGMIGLVIWDRRTFLKPVSDKVEKVVKENEEKFKKIEENYEINMKIIQILRKISENNKEVENMLKNYRLM